MIGGGRMGQALLSGLSNSGWAPSQELAVVEVDADQRARLSELFPGVAVLGEPLPGVDAVLAVKPYLAIDVCRSLDRPTRVISIAAGITIASLEAALAPETTVLRVMPNTPALLGAGASAVAGGTNAGPKDIAWAIGILSAVGVVVEVDEPAIDAVTGLSGSGPAYVFAFADALAKAGVGVGLSAEVATKLANQTILGAARLLTESGQSAIQLRDMVTTPGGTTEAGLKTMTDAKFADIIAAAVRDATKRSRELGHE